MSVPVSWTEPRYVILSQNRNKDVNIYSEYEDNLSNDFFTFTSTPIFSHFPRFQMLFLRQDTFNMFSKFVSNNNGDGTEILMIYGKQDRHVDGDGRQRTYKLMTDAGVHFEWLEVRALCEASSAIVLII